MVLSQEKKRDLQMLFSGLTLNELSKIFYNHILFNNQINGLLYCISKNKQI